MRLTPYPYGPSTARHFPRRPLASTRQSHGHRAQLPTETPRASRRHRHARHSRRHRLHTTSHALAPTTSPPDEFQTRTIAAAFGALPRSSTSPSSTKGPNPPQPLDT